jgi:hypothetical protein
MTVQLSTPRVRVLIERPDTADLLEVDVQTDNRDMIQWDATRPRRQWPMGSDAPVLWMTFLAWHAIRRTGGAPGYTPPDSFDAFSDTCVSVVAIDADGEPITRAGGTVAADPTPPEPATGSLSNSP